MLRSIFTQIWNQRRSNSWLLAELFVVFILLWYAVDVLYGYTYAKRQPKGYDLEHVYKVTLRANQTLMHYTRNQDSVQALWFSPLDEAMRRIRQHPAVESAATWVGTDTYSDRKMYQVYIVDSAHVAGSNIRYVSPEYFEVMRIPVDFGEGRDILSGKGDDETASSLPFASARWSPALRPIPAVLTRMLADTLFSEAPQSATGRAFSDYYAPDLHYRVAGICPSQKSDDYARYENYILTPMPQWFYTYYSLGYPPNISIRIRPEADTPGFARRFLDEMSPQLKLDPVYLFDVSSYADQKRRVDAESGNTSFIRSVRLVVAFFAFNVFIGLLGTFWFRTRHRRKEIALRMAFGSSRAVVRWQLMAEGLLLLTLAAVPALVVCTLLMCTDATVTDQADASWMRFGMVAALVWLLMAAVVMLGIGYPARQAMKVRPAEALHDE